MKFQIVYFPSDILIVPEYSNNLSKNQIYFLKEK